MKIRKRTLQESLVEREEIRDKIRYKRPKKLAKTVFLYWDDEAEWLTDEELKEEDRL